MPDGTPGCIRYPDGTCGCRMDCSTDEAMLASALECTLTGGVFDTENCACENYCTGQAAEKCRDEGKMLTKYPECDCIDITSSGGSPTSGSSTVSSATSSGTSSVSSGSSPSSGESGSSDPCASYTCYNGGTPYEKDDGDCGCDCESTAFPPSGCENGALFYYTEESDCMALAFCGGGIGRGDTPQPGPDPYPGGWPGDYPYQPVV